MRPSREECIDRAARALVDVLRELREAPTEVSPIRRKAG